MSSSIVRRAAAEGLGTAALVLGAFGGGHLAGKLGASPAEAAIVGTLAVVGTLVAVLHAIGSLTGGHVNPAVTLSVYVDRGLGRVEALAYVAAQLAGAFVGAMSANALWDAGVVHTGVGSVSGLGYVAECLAAGGLVALIHGSVRGGNGDRLPIVVPAFVMAASFAAPFGFANPAVTVAKSFAGDGPGPGALVVLLGCEMASAVVALFGVRWLYQRHAPASAEADAPAARAPEVGTGVPAGARTFELVHAPLSEGAANVLHDVAERLVRRTDLVVKHRDGRFLVLLDAVDDAAMASFERRINDHAAVALLAAGEPATPIGLRPVDAVPASA
jgi:glycerol uptake facilitator-like aquaporin